MSQQLAKAPSWNQGLAEIETHVTCRLCGRIRDFQLLRHPGGLVLKGLAHTFHAKQLAQHAVMEATDLPIAANEIEVI